MQETPSWLTLFPTSHARDWKFFHHFSRLRNDTLISQSSIHIFPLFDKQCILYSNYKQNDKHYLHTLIPTRCTIDSSNYRKTNFTSLRELHIFHNLTLQEIAIRINIESTIFCWFQHICENNNEIEPLCHSNKHNEHIYILISTKDTHLIVDFNRVILIIIN